MTDAHEQYDAWFEHTPTLRDLDVIGAKSNTTFRPWKPEIKLTGLKKLQLENLCLDPKSGRNDTWTKLARLETLVIKNCVGVVMFLTDLSVAYSELKDFPRNFKILINCVETCADQLRDMLKLRHGLEYLYISTSTAEKLDLSSLKNHGSSLQHIALDPGQPWSRRS